MHGYLQPRMSRRGLPARVLGGFRWGPPRQTSHSVLLPGTLRTPFPWLVVSTVHQIWSPVESWLRNFPRVVIIAWEQEVGNQELPPSQERGPLQLAWEPGRVLTSQHFRCGGRAAGSICPCSWHSGRGVGESLCAAEMERLQNVVAGVGRAWCSSDTEPGKRAPSVYVLQGLPASRP